MSENAFYICSVEHKFRELTRISYVKKFTNKY